jgi:branched-chain amino acid transport system substrate-binding protein
MAVAETYLGTTVSISSIRYWPAVHDTGIRTRDRRKDMATAARITRRRRLLWGAPIIALVAITAAACGSAGGGSGGGGESTDINVGVIFSSSGRLASYGEPAKQGALAEAKIINDAGGVNGHKIKIHFEDSKSDPSQAVVAARKLIVDDKVDVIIGATVSGETLAVSPVAASGKIPFLVAVSGTAVMPKGSSVYPYAFRVLGDNTGIADRVLQEATKSGKNVALLYEDDAYGTAAYKDMKTLGKKYGVNLVMATRAAADATNLLPQATQIKDANPQVVIMAASAPSMAGAFLKALKQAGVTAPVWVDPGSTTAATAAAAGSAVEGVNGIAYVDWKKPNSAQKQLIDAFSAAGYPAPSGVGPLQGANAVALVADAARKVNGTISRQKLLDAFNGLCPVQGLLNAPACFSPGNHPGYDKAAVTVVKAQGGQWLAAS